MCITIYGLLVHSNTEYSTNLTPQPREDVSGPAHEASGPFLRLDLWWTSTRTLTESMVSGEREGLLKCYFKTSFAFWQRGQFRNFPIVLLFEPLNLHLTLFPFGPITIGFFLLQWSVLMSVGVTYIKKSHSSLKEYFWLNFFLFFYIFMKLIHV